jgi:hypothetical protein
MQLELGGPWGEKQERPEERQVRNVQNLGGCVIGSASSPQQNKQKESTSDVVW